MSKSINDADQKAYTKSTREEYHASLNKDAADFLASLTDETTVSAVEQMQVLGTLFMSHFLGNFEKNDMDPHEQFVAWRMWNRFSVVILKSVTLREERVALS